MELALIPPFYYLSHTWDQKYHLVLPHLLHNPGYAQYVEDVVRDEEQHVILDNGLAEKQQVSPEALIALAAYYQPDELVVPDVLGDCEASIERAIDFVKRLDQLKEDHEYLGSLAFVAQGDTVKETLACALEYLHNPAIEPYVSTIMIPRRLVSTQEPHARLEVAERLHEELGFTHVNIHLLGGSRFNPREVRVAAQGHPYIRSMDTSMPYVFAMKAYAVDTTLAPPHRDGDNEYWTWKPSSLRPEQNDLIKYNIRTMRRWADGK